MPIPVALIGIKNPRTGRPYGREIREGLGGVRQLREARWLRDLRLGQVRLEEAQPTGASTGSLSEAMSIASELCNVDDDDTRECMRLALIDRAEELEKKRRWSRV